MVVDETDNVLDACGDIQALKCYNKVVTAVAY